MNQNTSLPRRRRKKPINKEVNSHTKQGNKIIPILLATSLALFGIYVVLGSMILLCLKYEFISYYQIATLLIFVFLFLRIFFNQVNDKTVKLYLLMTFLFPSILITYINNHYFDYIKDNYNNSIYRRTKMLAHVDIRNIYQMPKTVTSFLSENKTILFLFNVNLEEYDKGK